MKIDMTATDAELREYLDELKGKIAKCIELGMPERFTDHYKDLAIEVLDELNARDVAIS